MHRIPIPLPSISSVRLGFAISSFIIIEEIPKVQTGVKNVKKAAVRLINPKLLGPKNLAVKIPTKKDMTIWTIFPPISQLALFITLFFKKYFMNKHFIRIIIR